METKNRIRRKDTRADEIIDCAKEIFIEKGYENTSFADIAKKGNMARSTIYLYFKDKEELLRATLSKTIETNIKIFNDPKLKSIKTLAERLDFTLSLLNLLYKNESLKKLMIMLAELSLRHPEIAKMWKEEILSRAKAQWIKIIEDLNLSKEKQEFFFTSIFSIFFANIFTSACFKENSPLMQFDEYVKNIKEFIKTL